MQQLLETRGDGQLTTSAMRASGRAGIHLLPQPLGGDSQALKDTGRRAGRVAHEGQEHMVAVELLVAQRLCLLLREGEHSSHGMIEMLEILEHAGCAAYAYRTPSTTPDGFVAESRPTRFARSPGALPCRPQDSAMTRP